MSKLFFNSGSPFAAAFDGTANTLAKVSLFGDGLCTYLNVTFWNQTPPPESLDRGFLAGALLEIRDKYGRDFTDQMVGYALRVMIDDPVKMGESIPEYISEKLKIGAEIKDNDRNKWPEIEAILKKYNAL